MKAILGPCDFSEESNNAAKYAIELDNYLGADMPCGLIIYLCLDVL